MQHYWQVQKYIYTYFRLQFILDVAEDSLKQQSLYNPQNSNEFSTSVFIVST